MMEPTCSRLLYHYVCAWKYMWVSY